jgi:hypothetical protein
MLLLIDLDEHFISIIFLCKFFFQQNVVIIFADSHIVFRKERERNNNIPIKSQTTFL